LAAQKFFSKTPLRTKVALGQPAKAGSYEKWPLNQMGDSL